MNTGTYRARAHLRATLGSGRGAPPPAVAAAIEPGALFAVAVHGDGTVKEVVAYFSSERAAAAFAAEAGLGGHEVVPCRMAPR